MAEKIIDFESRFAGQDLIAWKRELMARMGHTIQLGDPAKPVKVYAKALINAGPIGSPPEVSPEYWGLQGRWIAQCPAPDCGGAEYVDFRNPVFMCCSCWNRHYNFKWLKVLIPSEKQVIEAELLKRPRPNRNWELHESVADLKRQNRERGING